MARKNAGGLDVSLKVYEGDTVIKIVPLESMEEAVAIARGLMAFLNGSNDAGAVYSYGATNERILKSIKREDV